MNKQERAPALPLTLSLKARNEKSSLAAQEDFSNLYQTYVNPVFRYLYSRVNSAEDAEDLTSLTFLQAYRSFSTLRDQSRFAPWLFIIARNKLNDFYRQRENNTTLNSEITAGSMPEPSAIFELDERIKQLRTQIFALPEEERELIRLRYLGELTYREIAVTLGKTEQSVKKSIYRLLARLKSQME